MKKQELKALIKETMREVIQEEKHKLCQTLIPYISDEEQQQLEAEFSLLLEEENEQELANITDWIKYGGHIL
ncbi:MAG: hypothetical protein AB4372_06920 [Xenococcus sp. (in: cyanobacteria)]